MPISGKANILPLIPKELITALDVEDVYTENGLFVARTACSSSRFWNGTTPPAGSDLAFCAGL